MTARIVNLRTVRKQKARAEARKAGDEAAARTGQSAGAVRIDEAQRALEDRRHDGHRRTDADTDDDG